MAPRRVAVVGAGWAGLAAAVEATHAGAAVTLFETAAVAGGRARDVVSHGTALDNGAHICIGAYSETLRLMRRVGVDEAGAFLRRPLTLVDADGNGLRLGPGAPLPSFVRAVLTRRGWGWRERWALLRVAAQWRRDGFRCAPERTVADLAAGLPERVRREFIEPLAIAALNTPADRASGAVLLRVLHDALGSTPGAADLLLPRRRLGELLPAPALTWLARRGATLRLGTRVERLAPDGTAWALDEQTFDRVVLAASAVESARLVRPHAAAWALCAAAMRYEPIVTVYAKSAGCVLPEPLLSLPSDTERPAQFVFDRGQLGGDAGVLAFVISGAATWLERGAAAAERATLAQAAVALQAHLRGPLEIVRTLTEKRATFACTPRLERPPAEVRAGVVACGDYVDGPYPATLEGAVRSGVAAAAIAMR